MLSPAPLRNACQLARHKDGRTTQRYLQRETRICWRPLFG